VQSFSWSPDGASLLVQTDVVSWSVFTPGTGATTLHSRLPGPQPWRPAAVTCTCKATARYIRWSTDGADEVIATNVSQAAVAPGGLRVAFVKSGGSASTLLGYDVGLRSQYELASEAGPR